MNSEVFNPLLEKESARQVMRAYTDAGYDIRFVGGCVRDCLNGDPVGDLDMATTATPEQGQGILEKAGIKTVPTGIAHGTITAVVDGHPFEITTLRRDVTTDGRRATVAYTSSWEEDAARRDFTINAMSVDREAVLYDPFYGQADLKAGRIRFIGDAVERIKEDALRILRFFRFNAHIGTGVLDEAGLQACIAHANLLQNLSKERINMEVKKLLKGKNVVKVWQVLTVAGLNQYFLKKSKNINALENLFHVKHQNKPLLLSLFEPSDRDAKALQIALKLSNKETDRIAAALMVYDKAWDHLTALLYYHGRQAVRDAALLRYADGIVDDIYLDWVMVKAADWQKPCFPVTGEDLLQAGYSQGKEMGDALKKMERYWVENDFKLTQEECLEIL